MINLKKLFRRKKGQGALEYLFMIAAALIIIFVVVRYISGTGQQATSQGDIAVLQSQAELVKSSFQAKGWWSDNTNVSYSNGNLTLEIPDVSPSPQYSVPTEYRSTLSDYFSSSNNNKKSIITVYNECQAGKLEACQVFGVLAGSTT
ncbi:class III signal peptide-containing protein [Thermococcus sp. 2319x1]|uniref:class III signal peptide-containing protein n=1 Tax=Thermococcus sp. 2319x1 TaxID=1674923 RepID=UPI00158230B7